MLGLAVGADVLVVIDKSGKAFGGLVGSAGADQILHKLLGDAAIQLSCQLRYYATMHVHTMMYRR